MRTRTIEILKKFISVDYPITIEMLSNEYQVSPRTIRNELAEINDFLSQQQLKHISTIRTKGLLLEINELERQQLRNRFDTIKTASILSREQRIFDILLNLAFPQTLFILSEKEKTLFISKSTLDEDMRKLRSLLIKYDIQIISSGKQGLFLTGSERSIRIMLYDIINQFYGKLTINDLAHNELNSIQKVIYKYIPRDVFIFVTKLAEQVLIDVNDDIYKNQIVIFTCIWLQRNLKNNFIKTSTSHGDYIPVNELSLFIRKLCREYNINLKAIEFKYIIFMLETFNAKDMNNSIEWVHAQLLSIKLIQFVEMKTGIPFSSQHDELYEGLCKHIAGLLARVKKDIHIINPLIDNIKQNYIDIYTAVTLFSRKLSSDIGKEISDNEISFLTIHFSASASSINQTSNYIYKAAVFCDHGIATANLLAETLKESFNIEVVAILNRRDLELSNKIDFDIIFTTFPIINTLKPTLVLEPIMRFETKEIISDFLKKHEKYKREIRVQDDSTELFSSLMNLIKDSGGAISAPIVDKLENILGEFNLKINKRKIQPMLKDVLHDENITLNQFCKDWQESIQIVAQPLLDNNTIQPIYVDAMINSVKEYGPYIVIGPYLALAHARPEDGVNKLGVSVATFKSPVDFGDEDVTPVKIIFCLAAVDSYSHLNIMRSLISLINDESKLDKLINSKTKHDFIKSLYSE